MAITTEMAHNTLSVQPFALSRSTLLLDCLKPQPRPTSARCPSERRRLARSATRQPLASATEDIIPQLFRVLSPEFGSSFQGGVLPCHFFLSSCSGWTCPEPRSSMANLQPVNGLHYLDYHLYFLKCLPLKQ